MSATRNLALAGVPQELSVLAERAAVLAHSDPTPKQERTFWTWFSKPFELLETYYRELATAVRDDEMPPWLMRLARTQARYVLDLSVEVLDDMELMAKRGQKRPPERRKFERLVVRIEGLLEDIEDRLEIASARDAAKKGQKPAPWRDVKAELEA